MLLPKAPPEMDLPYSSLHDMDGHVLFFSSHGCDGFVTFFHHALLNQESSDVGWMGGIGSLVL